MSLKNKASIDLSQSEINLILRLMEEGLMIGEEGLVKELENVLKMNNNKLVNLQLAQLYCKYNHSTWAKDILEQYILNGGKVEIEMINLLNLIKVNQWNE